MRRYKESRSSKKIKYYQRSIMRIVWLIVKLFVLFAVVMFVFWAVPKIWNLVFG